MSNNYEMYILQLLKGLNDEQRITAITAFLEGNGFAVEYERVGKKYINKYYTQSDCKYMLLVILSKEYTSKVEGFSILDKSMLTILRQGYSVCPNRKGNTKRYVINGNNEHIKLHQFVMQKNGVFGKPEEEVDHVSGCYYITTRELLEYVPSAENIARKRGGAHYFYMYDFRDTWYAYMLASFGLISADTLYAVQNVSYINRLNAMNKGA